MKIALFCDSDNTYSTVSVFDIMYDAKNGCEAPRWVNIVIFHSVLTYMCSTHKYQLCKIPTPEPPRRVATKGGPSPSPPLRGPPRPSPPLPAPREPTAARVAFDTRKRVGTFSKRVGSGDFSKRHETDGLQFKRALEHINGSLSRP